jgi:hypothetical protein
MDFSIDYANPSKLNDLPPFPYPPTWGMGAYTSISFTILITS